MVQSVFRVVEILKLRNSGYSNLEWFKVAKNSYSDKEWLEKVRESGLSGTEWPQDPQSPSTGSSLPPPKKQN